MITYYNCNTYQVTTYRGKCRQWIRAGYHVEVRRDDKCVLDIPENYFAGRMVPCNDVLFFGI